jgi:hypothetical protein
VIPISIIALQSRAHLSRIVAKSQEELAASLLEARGPFFKCPEFAGSRRSTPSIRHGNAPDKACWVAQRLPVSTPEGLTDNSEGMSQDGVPGDVGQKSFSRKSAADIAPEQRATQKLPASFRDSY